MQSVITERQTLITTDIQLESLTRQRLLTSTHLANSFVTKTVTMDPMTITECLQGIWTKHYSSV